MSSHSGSETQRWTFIPDILHEHVEELGFLWSQRRGDLRSPHRTGRSLRELEERIRGRLHGVLVSAGRGLTLLEAALESDDPELVFGAAFSLLHLGSEPLANRVLEAFARAGGEGLVALRDALANAPATPDLLHRAWSLLDSQSAPIAAAMSVALAFHGALTLTPAQVGCFLSDADAGVRSEGWRLVSYLQTDVGAKGYASGMRDDEEVVRTAVLEAGAWCRVGGVLGVAREFARNPAPEHLNAYYLLAVLSTTEDLPTLARLTSAGLGAGSIELLGTAGFPAAAEWILPALEDPDPALAAAAGRAFLKLTGIDVSSETRVSIAPPGKEQDEFDAEFADEVQLPDPERARAVWRELRQRVRPGSRLSRGIDVSQAIPEEAFDRLDMQSRWEVYLRSRFYGGWEGTPLQLEIFPRAR